MFVSHLLLILHKKIQFYIFMFEAWNVPKGRKVQGGQILSQGTVVGEPSEAIIWETKAVEFANKNVVIDRVESLSQVDEYGCTVMSLIDDGYGIV